VTRPTSEWRGVRVVLSQISDRSQPAAPRRALSREATKGRLRLSQSGNCRHHPAMSDEKPNRLPNFPMDDDRSVAYHIAVASADAVASYVPGGGYAVEQIIKRFIGEPLERRRETWFALIGSGVQELQDRLAEFDPSSLVENQEFISAVYQMTQIAMKTHSDQKRLALRNIVLNTAANLRLSDVLRGTFIHLADKYSDAHIAAVQIAGSEAVKLVNRSDVVSGAVSVEQMLLEGIGGSTDEHAAKRVISDLSGDRLLDYVSVDFSSTVQISGISETGEAFRRFISEPSG